MVLHSNLSSTNLHVPKTHTHVEADITDLQTYLTQTAADLLYAPIGQTTTFLGLTDTPGAYVADALVQVNAGGTALELTPIATAMAGYLPLTAGSGNPLDGDLYIGGGDLYAKDYRGDYQKVLDTGAILPAVTVGNSSLALFLTGSATRPVYLGADIALLSDINDDLPHYSKGSGDFNVIAVYNPIVKVNGTVKVSCKDMILSLQGGVASPSYTFYISKTTGTYGAGNSNPSDEYVTFTVADAGIQNIFIKVSDGTTTTTEVNTLITIA
jgi:hypothetical protein